MSSVSWESFKDRYFFDRQTGLGIDLSRLHLDDDFLSSIATKLHRAFEEMDALERGAISNPDEKRMVGHYWLRNPAIAPMPEIVEAITHTLDSIRRFAAQVHKGEIVGGTAKKLRYLLVVGIGGSALGPQFVNHALRSAIDPMEIFFFDNTDPDGMERTLSLIPSLEETLVVVISKSGGTKETRNGQLVAKDAFERAGLPFAKHFVAVTGKGSELDTTALREGWLGTFPMWDWVGGRTSELSAVGLLPAALQGFDIARMLEGARDADVLTRVPSLRENPAALLAVGWFHAGCGRGTKDMVVLPYRDRLELFSRYLQQLVMESLGKELDREGQVVHQGIAVYGNKGSTDQHAYVQQLRDGVNNFFAVFLEVLEDGGAALEVEPGITSGDYLSGFYQGTRRALFENGRESITVTVPTVNAYIVGLLIALFERAVGFYASMINVNAYHQPGVEAGKKAAGEVLALQTRIVEELARASSRLTVEGIAEKLHVDQESVFRIVRHLAANGRIGVTEGMTIFDDTYGK